MKLVIGCNYHTVWQKHKGMRFVLTAVSEDNLIATLETRKTGKKFNTNVSDLIFIESVYNREKADKLTNKLIYNQA